MVVINGTTITMVRGDTARISVGIQDAEGEPYVPAEGDRIRFAAKKKYTDAEPVINKEVDTTAMLLVLDPEDTKDLQMGSMKGRYVYDIELTQADGTVDTFIRGDLVLLEEII